MEVSVLLRAHQPYIPLPFFFCCPSPRETHFTLISQRFRQDAQQYSGNTGPPSQSTPYYRPLVMLAVALQWITGDKVRTYLIRLTMYTAVHDVAMFSLLLGQGRQEAAVIVITIVMVFAVGIP